eukprot:jgi/Botrbrau1/8283/Bobra.0251s0012.1
MVCGDRVLAGQVAGPGSPSHLSFCAPAAIPRTTTQGGLPAPLHRRAWGTTTQGDLRHHYTWGPAAPLHRGTCGTTTQGDLRHHYTGGPAASLHKGACCTTTQWGMRHHYKGGPAAPFHGGACGTTTQRALRHHFTGGPAAPLHSGACGTTSQGGPAAPLHRGACGTTTQWGPAAPLHRGGLQHHYTVGHAAPLQRGAYGTTSQGGCGCVEWWAGFNGQRRQRAGIYPIDDKEAYWFVCDNRPQSDPPVQRPRGQLWGRPAQHHHRARITDRWMAPGSRVGKGSVTLAGDSFHPMTPNLGQGGCTALEDAVVLGRFLREALEHNGAGTRKGRGLASLSVDDVAATLRRYELEREQRVYPLQVRSYAYGAALQLPFLPVVAARNLVAPLVFRPKEFLSHTEYNCGTVI